jgi:hypothetical protein
MIQNILTNHETTLENVKHVFYSNSQNDTLFISFAGKIDKYVSVTWFYNQYDFQGNFLFLKNDEENYNTYNDDKFMRVIQHYISKLNIKNIITYGPSMGGIASIVYGLKLNANLIISIDPNPINYDYKILLNQIINHENNYDYKNKIYLNYTFINNYDTLPQWTDEIINELKLKNVVLTIQPFRCIEHLSFIPTKEFLIDIIRNNVNFKVRNYVDSTKWI